MVGIAGGILIAVLVLVVAYLVLFLAARAIGNLRQPRYNMRKPFTWGGMLRGYLVFVASVGAAFVIGKLLHP